MSQALDLGAVLNQLTKDIQRAVPGAIATAIDVFVSHDRFLELKKDNPSMFSLTEDEPALTVRHGDNELIIFEERGDE